MSFDLFDFFPFNIRSGEDFLVFYAALGAFGVFLLVLMRGAYGSYLDNLAATADPSNAKKLRIGELPTPEQYYAIAYLQYGRAGVADTLIAIAHAAGCLQPSPTNPKSFLVSTAGAPPHSYLQSFLRYLVPSGEAKEGAIELTATEVRAAASAAAAESMTGIESELRASGMVRSAEIQSKVFSAIWIGGVLLLAVGGIRVMHAITIRRPFLFLAAEMVLLALAIFSVSRKTRESALKAAYLNWLKDSTGSLVLNVQSGWSNTPESVGLGVALAGARVLGTAAIAGGLVYAFNPYFHLPGTAPPVYGPQNLVGTGIDTASTVDVGSTWTFDNGSGGSTFSTTDTGSSTWSTADTSGGSDSGGSSGGSDSGGSSGCSGGSSGCSSGGGSSGCGGGGGSGCGGGGGGCGGGS